MNRKIIFFLEILILIGLLNACSVKYSSDINEVRDVAKIIENDFSKIEKNINEISKSFSEIMENEFSEERINNISKKYKYSMNGILYNPIFTDCSSALLSGYKEIDESLEQRLYKSELIDKEFIDIYNKWPIIDQIYLNSKDGILRVYPGVELISNVAPKENFSEFHFYYLADESHNKEKKSVWLLKPYLDPVTKKWATSLISPSYRDELLCVIGFDFLIENLRKQYLKEDMFLVSSDGNIIVTDSYYNELFGLTNIDNISYYETYMGEIYLSNNYNFKKNKNPEVRKLFEKIIENGGKQFTYEIYGEYTVIVEEIDVIDSFLVKMIFMN